MPPRLDNLVPVSPRKFKRKEDFFLPPSVKDVLNIYSGGPGTTLHILGGRLTRWDL
eukprot:jgi/Botrbrau1/1351/Bobra.0063s0062.1